MNDEPCGELYVVDTSSWIALFRNYPRRHSEGTWAGMNGLIDRGLVTSPSIVYDEISARQDDLLSWINDRPQIFFEPDREMLGLVAQISGKFPLLNKNKSRSTPIRTRSRLPWCYEGAGCPNMRRSSSRKRQTAPTGLQRSRSPHGTTTSPASTWPPCLGGKDSKGDPQGAAGGDHILDGVVSVVGACCPT